MWVSIGVIYNYKPGSVSVDTKHSFPVSQVLIQALANDAWRAWWVILVIGFLAGAAGYALSAVLESSVATLAALSVAGSVVSLTAAGVLLIPLGVIFCPSLSLCIT